MEDELAAEARIVTLKAERERERTALRSVEAALDRVRTEAKFRTWPRAFARGLAWGVVLGFVAGLIEVFRVVGC